jgi:hypothetical protein
MGNPAMTWARPIETLLKIAAGQWRLICCSAEQDAVPVNGTPSMLTMEQFWNEKTP